MARRIIFPIDGVHDSQFHVASALGLPAMPLFELSHGAGIRPEKWPSPISKFCGYAGDFGPETLTEDLKKISDAAGDTPVWIDMTRVRSDNDRLFDLNKVKRVLDIVTPYVVNE